MKANIAAFSHPLLLLFWAWSLVANRCSNCAAERFSSATTNNNSSQVTDVTSISAAKNVSRECKIPQFVGDWQPSKRYRFPVAEAQGAMLGNSFFIVVAGFTWGFRSVTRKVFALDTSKPWKTWQRLDKVPVAITHSALAVVNDTLIAICGGYVGGAPGPHTDDCFVLDPFLRRGQQWSRIAKLPDGGRAGGGMIYDSLLNALVFAAGAQRPERNQRTAIDFNTTWMYSFDNPDAGWVVKAPIPFRGNHLSSVTAVDASGHERHYFAGGQKEEDEANGNSADHYEYDAVQNVWIPRQFLPIPRGHASSSTRATGTCGGYIVAAGCTNGDQKIADVSYYDIARDAWTSIGNLTRTMNTPVCDFGFGERGNVLYCESGSDRKWFSQKIEIAFS